MHENEISMHETFRKWERRKSERVGFEMSERENQDFEKENQDVSVYTLPSDSDRKCMYFWVQGGYTSDVITNQKGWRMTFFLIINTVEIFFFFQRESVI